MFFLLAKKRAHMEINRKVQNMPGTVADYNMPRGLWPSAPSVSYGQCPLKPTAISIPINIPALRAGMPLRCQISPPTSPAHRPLSHSAVSLCDIG